MIIDWKVSETDELKDVADGIADAAEMNLGLPFALVLRALDDETRAPFIARLREVVAQFRDEGAENA